MNPSPRGNYYKNAISCLVEIESKYVIDFLPQGLFPLEVQHNISLLNLTAFEFYESPVGAYSEILVSVVTAPHLFDASDMPKSAIFPINIISNTELSQNYTRNTYHLPHYMDSVNIDFAVDNGEIRVIAADHSSVIIDMSVPKKNDSKKVNEYHQVFFMKNDLLSLSRVEIQGFLSENQDEMGVVKLNNHKMFKNLDVKRINNIPFLERQGIDGCTTIFDFVRISEARADQLKGEPQ